MLIKNQTLLPQYGNYQFSAVSSNCYFPFATDILNICFVELRKEFNCLRGYKSFTDCG